MQKIGIITFHSGYNEGAILQALALAKHLSRVMPEWKVEIVDLYYAAKQQIYERETTERAQAMENFIRTHLPLSAEKYVLQTSHEEALKQIGENYQALVYGSDEIWKLRYGRRFLGLPILQDPFFPAFPNAYWPDKSLGIPAFAYAACIGETIPHRIPSKHRVRMREGVSSLALIGVRDSETRRFVEWLDPALSNRIVKVPDPTFSVRLIDDGHVDAVRDKLVSWGVDFSRPVVAAVCRDDHRIGPLLKQFRDRGFQSAGFVLKNSQVDIDLSSKPLSPLEWMAAFRLFRFCVSERMHACISCLLGGTPVIAVDFLIGKHREGSKLKDLFEEFELSPFHYAAYSQSVPELLRIGDQLEAGEWPDTKVRQHAGRFRALSLGCARQLRTILEARIANEIGA